MVNIVIIISAILIVKSTASERHLLSLIDEQVDNINKNQTLWKAATNEIARKGLSCLWGVMGKFGRPEDSIYYSVTESFDFKTIPFSFDARREWPKCPSITSIKDQGRCGSCWAVGVASCASDRFCIQTKYNIKVNVSAYNLLACCDTCHPRGYNGCAGGDPYEGWIYLKNKGLCSGGDYNSNEGCQPYPIHPTDVPVDYDEFWPKCSSTCLNTLYPRSFSNDIYKGVSAYVIKPNELAIQKEILINGPVLATFQVYLDFIYYSSGIYKRTSSQHLGGHAVKLIGWGVDKGTKYWLAANSWGRSWGENGYFRILRGHNECEFESYLTAGLCDLGAPESLVSHSPNSVFAINSRIAVVLNLVLIFFVKDLLS